MRAIAISLALAALFPDPLASAQKLGASHLPPRPRYALLTVRYMSIGGTRMTLSTPAGTFTCAPPSLPVGLPMANCTLAVPRVSTVALTAHYLILGPVAQTGKGRPMTGKQWQGACAGTASDTCTLAMTQDRTVEISPYAAP